MLLSACFLQVHVLIFTLVMPPIGMYQDFLLVTDYIMVDVLVVHVQIFD